MHNDTCERLCERSAQKVSKRYCDGKEAEGAIKELEGHNKHNRNKNLCQWEQEPNEYSRRLKFLT